MFLLLTVLPGNIWFPLGSHPVFYLLFPSFPWNTQRFSLYEFDMPCMPTALSIILKCVSLNMLVMANAYPANHDNIHHG